MSSLIYLGIVIVLFNGITFILIFFYYCKIVKELKTKILAELQQIKDNIFMFRMFGYQILYLILLFLDILLIFQLTIKKYDNTFMLIRMLGKAIYPLANSIIYGFTITARKYLYNIFVNRTSFELNENFLNELRILGEIRPRVYEDLIDVSSH